MWACDFTVVYDWVFRQGYIFVGMELETRRIVHTGATKFPTDEWTAQQLREATQWGGPKHLIRDRDSKYAARFSAVAVSSGIQEGSIRLTTIRNDLIKGSVSGSPIIVICNQFYELLVANRDFHNLFRKARYFNLKISSN